MHAYPRLKRLAVLTARDAGKSTAEVAEKFGVSESWVRRVVQHRRELGKLGPYKFRRRDRHGGSLHTRMLYIIIEEPRITVRELEKVLGTKLDIDQLSSVKDELHHCHRIVWYGGLGSELSLSPTGNITVNMSRFRLPLKLEEDLAILNREA